MSLNYNSGNTEREQTSIAVQAMLRKVGVAAEVAAQPWGTFVTNYEGGKMPMFVSSSLDLPIIEKYLLTQFHSTSAGAKGNYAFYANPGVDSLIDRLLGTSESAERRQIIAGVQKLVNADVPSVPIYDTLLMYAQRSWVKGWVLYPSGNWYFARVEKRL